MGRGAMPGYRKLLVLKGVLFKIYGLLKAMMDFCLI